MDKILLPFHQNKLLNSLFVSNIFISFHWALVIYINSSFLSGFFTETQISSLYIIGSIVSSILLLNASKLLEKTSNYKFTICAISIEFLSIFGLFVSTTPFLIGFYFVMHLAMMSVLFFNMDVFVESLSCDEKVTGSIRGTYLTITNIMLVLAPFTVSFLVKGSDYSLVYVISSLLMIPLYFSIRKFKYVDEAKIHHIKIKETIGEYIRDKNLNNVFMAHALLQLFYGFMIIYTPIYLQKYIGFEWSEIGIIFMIMLLPFVIFELPAGELADNKYGEKEFMTIGFLIMGLFTLFVSFVTVKSFWIWASLLFMTRVGASLVEVSSESYFFKKVNKEKTDVISLFRMSRPLALMFAPITATIVLQFIPFQYIFIVIGSIMIVGSRYAQGIVDTK